MRFNEPLMIPVYVYTDEELESRKIGLEDDCYGTSETEERAFWSIDSAWKEKGNIKNTCFSTCGDSFVSPIEFKEFLLLIKTHIEICQL